MANMIASIPDFFARERAFRRLEKLDDEVVNLISEMDEKGHNVEAWVSRYLALDTFDEKAYRKMRDDLKEVCA